ncbi:MAG TPA: hypothetical protein DC036_05475, partial [Alphaproteobacteria bacterium]|nr:hypothetical protein [Alphaproteobacteria bacterium]
AARQADYAGFQQRRKQSEANGLLRGIGIANPIEVAGGPFQQTRPDNARVTASADGLITIAPGLMSVGQGHETAVARLTSQMLGVPTHSIVYAQGDTDLLPTGRGNGGSAATVVGLSAVKIALDELITQGQGVAAAALGCAATELTYRDGAFATSDGQTMAWVDIARHSNQAGGISVLGEFTPPDVTYPNGCHICEVEIDPKTGKIAFCDYVVVEDVGTVL